MPNPNQKFYTYAIGGLLALLSVAPIIAVFSPRAISVVPLICGLPLFFLYKVETGVWPSIVPRVFILILPICILMCASILWAVDMEIALNRTIKTVPLLLSGMILLQTLIFLPPRYFSIFEKVFPVAVIVAGAILAIDLLSHGGIYQLYHADLEGRVNLSWLNRSVFMFVICSFVVHKMLMPKNFVQNFKNPHRNLWPLLILYAPSALVFFATDSQTAQLMILIGILSAIIIPPRWKLVFYGLSAVIIIFTWVLPWLSQYIFAVFADADLQAGLLKHAYAGPRIEIWDFVGRKIAENPLYGFGAESARAIEFDSAMLFRDSNTVLHPHNILLQLWIEFGLLGALYANAFTILILVTIRDHAQQNLVNGKLAMAIFLSLMAAGMVSYGLWQGWWIGMLICVIAYVIAADKVDSIKRS